MGFLWYAIASAIPTGQLTFWTGPLFDVTESVSGTVSLCIALRYGGSRSELWSNLPRERGPRKPRRTWTNDLRSCTMHVDSIKSFICQTNAHKLL